MDRLAGAPSLYAFDFDGTLARIVRDHQGARLSQPIRDWLRELGGRAPTAVISGRSVADLRTLVGVTVSKLIGNHGLEGLHATPAAIREAKTACSAWKRQLAGSIRNRLRDAGAWTEDKTYSLAFHYRGAMQKRQAHHVVLEVVRQLSPAARIIPGKSVVSVVPVGCPHKGQALLALMKQLRCTAALYVGDDDTDEDVFSLRDPRIVTVRVGKKRASAARFYLERQSEITALLRYLVTAYDRSDRTCVPPP